MTTEITNQVTVIGAGDGISAQTEKAVKPAKSNSVQQDVTATGTELSPETTSQSIDQLEQAAEDISQYIKSVNRELQFSVDESLPLGRAVIKVLDAETGEIIREIPSAEALAISKRIKENLTNSDVKQFEGLIISKKA